MKLSKRFGLVGFLIGFVGPVLFYASPASFFTFESHFVCPWCPDLFWLHATRLTWMGAGLRFGLFSGLILAAVGFALGYAASRAIHAN